VLVLKLYCCSSTISPIKKYVSLIFSTGVVATVPLHSDFLGVTASDRVLKGGEDKRELLR
jgi:hypothetical protein